MSICIHRSIILASASLSLCGCAGFGGFAASPIDLRGDSYTKSKAYCYDESMATVGIKVKGYMQACYKSTTMAIPVGGTVIFLPETSEYFVEEAAIPNGRQYTQKTDYGYTFGADVTAEEKAQCKTKLSMYAMNFMWARSFDKIDNYVNGKEISCPH
jgi:hypothetical protein